ncbi:hypothetical protein ACU635_36300 [[Actinomadura] parvosata]|uniref:hypothetical protein n=1 Tax=[Actinomadura] parvosata TaxID=1955412 RepID=UPI00406C4EA3
MIHSTGETVQGSGTWRPWQQVTFAGDESATDPTAFAFSNAGGSSWAFLYRNADHQTRVYQVSTQPSALERQEGAAVTFSREELPEPPK